jgi:sugar lactone lactonase YvrE
MTTALTPRRIDRTTARPWWAWPGPTVRLGLGAAVAVAAMALPATAQASTDPGGPGPGPATPVSPTQIYVTDHSPPDWWANGMVLRVDPGPGTRTLLSDNHTPVGGPDFQAPTGIALDAAGNLIVAENFETPVDGLSSPSIIRVDRVTGARTLVSGNTTHAGPALVYPWGLAIEADGDILVADPVAFPQGQGGLWRVDPDTGARTALSRNGSPAGAVSFHGPSDVAVAPNGDVYVVDDVGVLRVDPATGARTRVSRNNSPAGAPTFADPQYLTVDAAGDILVSDPGADRIIRVDPVTGVRTTVSDNANPVGGPTFQLLGDLVPDCGDILVVDTAGGAVLRVDANTGVRTTVSDDTTPGPTFGFAFGIAVRHTVACPLAPLP